MRRARGEKGETNLSRRGETEHSRRDKERIGGTVGGGRRGGRSKREKGEAVRGATKVAVTLYKASKPNERGPKGKKTRRSALRGDAEGEGTKKKREDAWEGEDGRDVRWKLLCLVQHPRFVLTAVFLGN